jgi:hypothetical protein
MKSKGNKKHKPPVSFAFRTGADWYTTLEAALGAILKPRQTTFVPLFLCAARLPPLAALAM